MESDKRKSSNFWKLKKAENSKRSPWLPSSLQGVPWRCRSVRSHGSACSDGHQADLLGFSLDSFPSCPVAASEAGVRGKPRHSPDAAQCGVWSGCCSVPWEVWTTTLPETAGMQPWPPSRLTFHAKSVVVLIQTALLLRGSVDGNAYLFFLTGW